MDRLIHVIYCSSSSRQFSIEEMTKLLDFSRKNNRKHGITGMLLHTDGSFFQVIEGLEEEIENLMSHILKDTRHFDVTMIVKESIAQRSFSDWSMAFTSLHPQEADKIIGVNDFSLQENPMLPLIKNKTKMILNAFKTGSWRKRLNDLDTPEYAYSYNNKADYGFKDKNYNFSFAYQPIVDIKNGLIFSYEALVRGVNNESAGSVFKKIDKENIHSFDEKCRQRAIKTAAALGLSSTKVNVNFLPMSLAYSKTAVSSMLDTAKKNGLSPDQIVLEVLESEIISDIKGFAKILDLWRTTGMVLAIDDFGSGHAGLNLLADFQPDILKLDMDLIRDIDTHGPRQAIVRGVQRTCSDLGIMVIAEGVETASEFNWLKEEGIELFQGNLLAPAKFEELVGSVKNPLKIYTYPFIGKTHVPWYECHYLDDGKLSYICQSEDLLRIWSEMQLTAEPLPLTQLTDRLY